MQKEINNYKFQAMISGVSPGLKQCGFESRLGKLKSILWGSHKMNLGEPNVLRIHFLIQKLNKKCPD